MQRIVCRYRKDASAGPLGPGELRTLFRQAAEQAGLPVSEGKGILLGPALPTEVTSDAERLVLELSDPCEPSDVRERLNPYLPPGLVIDGAWVGRPGGTENNPSLLDEAVYDVHWHDAPLTGTRILEQIRAFLLSPSVMLTREREKKVQQLDARALTREVRVITIREEWVHLQITVSVGPRGSLRPEEALQAMGFAPVPGSLCVQRIALQQSGWQRPVGPPPAGTWRRTPRHTGGA
jgi:radical SAM-linked protein